MDNYLEVMFEDKIYIQRSPVSKITEFSLNGIKLNHPDKLPDKIKEIIKLNKEIEKDPESFFIINKLLDGSLKVRKVKENPLIKDYIKIPEYINGVPVTVIDADLLVKPLKKIITQVHLPSTLLKMDSAAFRDCISLKYVNIPDNIKYIPNLCFIGCINLENIYLNNVTELNYASFYACNSLKKIDLSNVKILGTQVFQECFGLKDVILPDTLTDIPKETFCTCTRLEKITLPESVISISEGAFKGCTALCDIIFPENLKVISKDAFEDCTALKEFIAPQKLETIEKNAFKASGLKTLKIEQKVQIEDHAFQYCKLDNIKLHSETEYKKNTFEYPSQLKINFLSSKKTGTHETEIWR